MAKLLKNSNDMSFNDEVRLKAQLALKPYLASDSPFQVKNPILLLNYLYQHAIIPSPRYNVIPATQNHLQHAVSCEIGDLQIIGTGNTKKVAKTSAAQQFLELFLKPVDISRVPNSLFGVSPFYNKLDVYAAVSSYNVNGDNAHISQNRVSFSNIKNRIQNSMSNEVSVVEPQMAQDESVHIHFQGFPEKIVNNTSASQTVGKISADKFQIASSLTAQQQSKCNTDIISKDTRQKTFFSTTRDQPNCEDFFDPFFKQRPPNPIGTMMMEDMKNTEICDQNMENELPQTNTEPTALEEKNVFALLQKKTQKHLKLIPRFRTETIESGFRCNVQLGSYRASGEGRNKKIAKTRAAINLLEQINDLN